MDWGATWLSCRVPVAGGEREVLPGCARGWPITLPRPLFSARPSGACANRIGGAQLTRQGRTIALTPTAGGHQLHGGPQGFDRRRWRVVRQTANEVVLGIESADGDQGFPGKLCATVCYRLEAGGRLAMDYTAKVDALSGQSDQSRLFQLDGAATDIRQHSLRINAQYYLPVAPELIPLGPLQRVEATSFDFSRSKPIGRDFLADEQQRLARLRPCLSA